MSPKTHDFDRFLFFKNLINQAVPNVDPPGIKSLQIANQFFIRWWSQIRVFSNDIDEGFSLRIQMGSF